MVEGVLTGGCPDLNPCHPNSMVSFKIIQSAPNILPVFDTTLQQVGLQALQAEGIEVLLNKVKRGDGIGNKIWG